MMILLSRSGFHHPSPFQEPQPIKLHFSFLVILLINTFINVFLFTFSIFFFRGWDWGLNSGVHTCKAGTGKEALYSLNHASSSFCSGYFRDGVSRTICLDCPRTTIFLKCSQVARITGMGHKHPAYFFNF
jgi:hypothetical protein